MPLYCYFNIKLRSNILCPVFTVHVNYWNSCSSAGERLQLTLGEGTSFAFHVCVIHSPCPHLFTLPQKPFLSPSGCAHSGSSSVPAQGWQSLGSFFSLPACLLSPCCGRNKVTWYSGYVCPRKVHRSLKPKIFSYSAREGVFILLE